MSSTPTSISLSAFSRPFAGRSLSSASFGSIWACSDEMSYTHPTNGHVSIETAVGTTGSKRLNPGSFAGVLT